MTQYRSYQHVEHLHTGGFAAQMLKGDCWYQTKMDGTNTVVGKGSDGIWVGKRKNVMGEGDDNRGIKDYVLKDNIDKFEAFFTAHPNCVLYGEWLVPHTIRTYLPQAWNKFYIFDVVEMMVDENGDQKMVRYVPYVEYQPWLDVCGLTYVPATRYVPDTSKSISEQIEDLQTKACQQTYMMQDGCYGEGIVVKNYTFHPKCPVECIQWAKVVTKEFKLKHRPETALEPGSFEERLVSEFLDTLAITKEFMKIAEEYESEEAALADKKSVIPRTLGTVWYAFLEDNLKIILKKYKNPTIDFRTLQTYVYETTKTVMGW